MTSIIIELIRSMILSIIGTLKIIYDNLTLVEKLIDAKDEEIAQLRKATFPQQTADLYSTSAIMDLFHEAYPDQKIEAIKLYRAITDVGLKEAQDWVTGRYQF